MKSDEMADMHIYEVRPRKDHRGVDLISRLRVLQPSPRLKWTGFR